MANAKPSMMHGDDAHDNIPTPEAAPAKREPIRVLNVSGKAVSVVSEEKLGCGTIRRDYE